MPDDEIITEQEIPETPDEGAKEAQDAFDEDETQESTEEPVEEPEEKEPVEEPIEDEPEEDEDEQRGKELIEQETEAEKKAREAQEEDQRRVENEQREREAKQGPVPYNQSDTDIFHNLVPDTLFPESVNLGDLEDQNLREYIKENPEVKTIASIVSKYMIDTLINNNYIPSYKGVQDMIGQTEQRSVDQRFTDRVLDKIPNAIEINNSKDYKEWLPKQSEEVKALDRSGKASDKVRVLKRFMNSAGIKEAEKKIAELDEKRDKSRQNDEGIYKTTGRSNKRASRSSSSGLSGRDEALEEFEKDDD